MREHGWKFPTTEPNSAIAPTMEGQLHVPPVPTAKTPQKNNFSGNYFKNAKGNSKIHVTSRRDRQLPVQVCRRRRKPKKWHGSYRLKPQKGPPVRIARVPTPLKNVKTGKPKTMCQKGVMSGCYRLKTKLLPPTKMEGHRKAVPGSRLKSCIEVLSSIRRFHYVGQRDWQDFPQQTMRISTGTNIQDIQCNKWGKNQQPRENFHPLRER